MSDEKKLSGHLLRMKSMEKVKINTEKCKGCQLCIYFCPSDCLKISDKINKAGYKAAVFINQDKCKSCGFCFLVCPDIAIEVYKATDEHR